MKKYVKQAGMWITTKKNRSNNRKNDTFATILGVNERFFNVAQYFTPYLCGRIFTNLINNLS